MANYKVENMRKELENDMNRARALGAAWGAVVRNFTKSGAAFKVLSKNFTGCSFHAKSFSPDPVVSVYTSATGCGYISDDLDVRISLNRYNEDKRPADAARVLRNSWGGEFFDMDAAELEDAIKARGAYWGRRAAELEKQLAACDNAAEVYRAALAAALEALEAAAGGRNTLYHATIKAVTEYDARHI